MDLDQSSAGPTAPVIRASPNASSRVVKNLSGVNVVSTIFDSGKLTWARAKFSDSTGTINAVKAFQRSKGLPDDGITGGATKDAILRALEARGVYDIYD